MKTDEEQKKKEEQQNKQNSTNKANWIMPCNGKISSPYGWRIHPTLKTKKFHDGVDIGVNLNTPVKAVASGIVVKAEWYNGYGKYIEIDYGNSITSFYGHLNEFKVCKNQFVKQGQIIALSGNTAGIGANGKVMTTGPHLPFGVHENGDSANPLDFIRNF
ncbi:MAG: M23 family metallopeptidase [Candidatus Gastranaerophilaceae bacterium]|nr:M23 family metallopeptidase [Candidatus Gastranaerophilaceae bacterium]